MFEKLIDSIEKFINWIEKDREKQAEKIRAKRAAYLESRRRQLEAENKKALLENLQKKEAQKRKSLSSFTTMEEFKKIVESSQYKRMTEKEREIFLKRRNELRKNDAKFAADYERWSNEKARRRKEVKAPIVKASRRVRCI